LGGGAGLVAGPEMKESAKKKKNRMREGKKRSSITSGQED
jgi:hypothetical protein